MKLLIIEDDQKAYDALKSVLLEALELEISQADSYEEGIELLITGEFDLVIGEHIMEGINSLAFLRNLVNLKLNRLPKVIILNDYLHTGVILEAFRNGAYDFLIKPINVSYLIKRIQKLMNKPDKEFEIDENTSFIGNIPEYLPMGSIHVVKDIGKIGFFSEEMHKLEQEAFKLHEHKKSSVLIQGETGTGKEIFARLIHFGNNKKAVAEKPFVCVNCSAISANLFESEFFGYESGAFTGADPKGKKGKLELAADGTIFLDEIADMPLEFQPKLLRVLEERKFYRISGNKEITFNARVICATNNSLLKMVNQGSFRKDLYYRLNTANLKIPPLRERKADIVPLAKMFLDSYRPKNSNKLSIITEGAKELLKSLHWSGNVRELQTAMERIAFRFNDRFLQSSHIESVVDEAIESNNKFFYLDLPDEGIEIDKINKLLVLQILRMNNNNITQTAKYLGTTRNRIKRIAGL